MRGLRTDTSQHVRVSNGCGQTPHVEEGCGQNTWYSQIGIDWVQNGTYKSQSKQFITTDTNSLLGSHCIRPSTPLKESPSGGYAGSPCRGPPGFHASVETGTIGGWWIADCFKPRFQVRKMPEFSHGDWTVKNKDLTNQHNGAKTIINHPFGNGLYHVFGYNFEPRKFDLIDLLRLAERYPPRQAPSFHGKSLISCAQNLDHFWLVVLTVLKNDGVRQWVSDDIPYMKWKHKKCLKPPTRSKIIDHHKYMG